jgi:hypothetical protein
MITPIRTLTRPLVDTVARTARGSLAVERMAARILATPRPATRPAPGQQTRLGSAFTPADLYVMPGRGRGRRIAGTDGLTATVHTSRMTGTSRCRALVVEVSVTESDGSPYTGADVARPIGSRLPGAAVSRVGKTPGAWMITYPIGVTLTDAGPAPRKGAHRAPVGAGRLAALVTAGYLVTVLAVAAFAVIGGLYAMGARGLCPTEDSAACVWVGPAPFVGNGRGGIVVNR